MPVEYQKYITKQDQRRNPTKYYLMGDNEERWGSGGQAKEMRGEPNTIGVRTKAAPERHESAYWSDANYEENCRKIDEDLAFAFDVVRKGGTVVIPTDGLGTGFAELPRRAPRTLAYLNERLKELAG